MNYLAHLYLSGESEKIMVGNFIGDYVKGRQFEKFPEEVAKGILLHRSIDSFTDKHHHTKEAKKLFREDFGLYSGIVVDFLFDHFLAKNWTSYSDVSLRTFSKRAHAVLLSNHSYLPQRVQGFLPFLIQNKRLESYASIDGIVQSMHIMSNYSSLPSKSDKAKEILESNYSYLLESFCALMSDLIHHVCTQHKIKLKRPDFSTEP